MSALLGYDVYRCTCMAPHECIRKNARECNGQQHFVRTLANVCVHTHTHTHTHMRSVAARSYDFVMVCLCMLKSAHQIKLISNLLVLNTQWSYSGVGSNNHSKIFTSFHYVETVPEIMAHICMNFLILNAEWFQSSYVGI